LRVRFRQETCLLCAIIPNGTSSLLSIPLMAAAIYLLLVVALIALCFSCSPEVLAKIAVVGWFTSWFWRGDRISFEEMFYGDWSYHNFSLVRHVGFGQLTIVLLGVMLALFLVSRSEDRRRIDPPRIMSRSAGERR